MKTETNNLLELLGTGFTENGIEYFGVLFLRTNEIKYFNFYTFEEII